MVTETKIEKTAVGKVSSTVKTKTKITDKGTSVKTTTKERVKND